MEMTKERAEQLGYNLARPLPNGNWLGLYRAMFEVRLSILDVSGRNIAWLYEHYKDALSAYEQFSGEGDPPGNWRIQKPSGRLNPFYTDEFRA
jgi:hypothetical protein